LEELIFEACAVLEEMFPIQQWEGEGGDERGRES
jgi:hypothetical protein